MFYQPDKKPRLLFDHYKKVLENIAAELKIDGEFIELLTSLKERTKDLETHKALEIFLRKEITLQGLGSLAHVLFHKEKERQPIDNYLKMNYGIPSLYAFVSKRFNLRRVDPRLVEISGKHHLTIYPELSATFAELPTQEIAKIFRLGSDNARKNITTLLQIAFDAGKIEEDRFIKVTRKTPGPSKIYTGPTLRS